jgi:hypothetical protein
LCNHQLRIGGARGTVGEALATLHRVTIDLTLLPRVARGLTEVGLGLWRSAVERVFVDAPVHTSELWLAPWRLAIQSVAVTAHAHVHRLELVAEPVDRLRQQLRPLIADPSRSPVNVASLGTVLHALGMVGLASAETGADTGAVRMIALAERLRVVREFQPTMSADRARQAAVNADRAAYADAVSEYAALERDGLREAACALISGRG